MGKDLTRQRTQDREMEAWRLRCTGLTQFEVAERMGLSQPAVSKILARVGERLSREFVEEQRQIRMQQTAILETVASEAFQAWEKSKLDAESVATVAGRVRIVKDGDGSEHALPLPDQVTTTITGQSGQSAHLAQVREALSDIRSIWGMDAPKKQEHSGPDGSPIEFRNAGYALDSKLDRLAASLEAERTPLDPDR